MPHKRQLPPPVHSALQELKMAMEKLYGDRLQGLYLYGSYARGTADADSDVDVLIVLAGPVKPGAEITYVNPVVSDISLKHDLLISTCPVSVESLQTPYDPFFENVRREAVPL